MKEYIINLPHLQSFKKRTGALFISAVCWLMWIYLLIPLITLGGWLLGQKKLTDEMLWFGGYKSLLQLLQIYAVALLILAVIWLCWVFYCTFHKPKLLPKHRKVVSDPELCDFYQVKLNELQQCRTAGLVTVFFDGQGQIIHLEPGISLQKNNPQ